MVRKRKSRAKQKKVWLPPLVIVFVIGAVVSFKLLLSHNYTATSVIHDKRAGLYLITSECVTGVSPRIARIKIKLIRNIMMFDRQAVEKVDIEVGCDLKV